MAYSIRFRYYLNYTDLVNDTDVTRIPQSFDTVIIDGALYHMYMFKDNPESAQIAYQSFLAGLKDLQTLFINNYEYVRDSRDQVLMADQIQSYKLVCSGVLIVTRTI